LGRGIDLKQVPWASRDLEHNPRTNPCDGTPAFAAVAALAAGSGPRFCLYIHHTDAAREWAYDCTSSIGRLDKGLDEATAKGWTVVSMKEDWRRIYPAPAGGALK
jgi:hypothetical protein